MKIGILTVPFNNNYGGLLQAFALKSVLGGMGHDTVIINRRRNRPTGFKFKVYALLVKLHLIDDYLSKKTAALSVNTDRFKEKYLEPITEPYYSTQELRRCLDLGINAFLVGSDQVWRYRYAKDSIDDYFFSFLDGTGIPRFSYAASFGTEVMDYPEDKRVTVTQLLKQFCGLSVREESGKDLLVDDLGVAPEKVHTVLDPTLLLSSDDYKQLFQGQSDHPRGYLFTYILDEAVIDSESISSLMKSMDLRQVDIKAQTGDASKQEVIEPVEKWLSAIYYSDFVITDSFHGTVFSIIFNKSFLTVANPTRGIARLQALLKQFGLEDRLVMSPEQIMSVPQTTIDWSVVNMKIQELKASSMNYLVTTIDSIVF